MATALPIHPTTGLQAIYVSPKTGRAFWPILGASEDGDGADGADDGNDSGHTDVSLEELQASLRDLGLTPGQLKGRLAASRKWEDRAKGKDAEFQSAKEKAAQYDVLLAASQTDQERAVEDAKRETRAAALQEAAPRIVRAEFRAAAKGVLTDTQLAALLEDRDLTKYVTESGDPDTVKIGKVVEAAAPEAGQRNHADLGQGRQRTDVKPSVAGGRELFEASRKRRSA